MTQQVYKPTDNVEEGFAFELSGGKKYLMRYPLTEEIEEMQRMTEEAKTAQDEGRLEDAKNLAKQLDEFTHKFITPEGHDTPVDEALKKENVRVLRNFNRMIQAELSIQ